MTSKISYGKLAKSGAIGSWLVIFLRYTKVEKNKKKRGGIVSEEKRKYGIMSEEITNLIANERFAEAAKIADKIDWRKVRSYSMLQRISDLYKINRRLDDALDIMLLAYDRSPNSKTIVYSICELYLEIGDQVTALQYMSVYNKMAPNDVGGAILKYRLLEFAEATYEDRVAQLEKICSMGYFEEWDYQLAYTYHCMGLSTKSVECCDRLISFWGKGAFVIKAMELKMLHAKLTPEQQAIYDHRNDVEGDLKVYESDSEEVPGQPEDAEEDFHVKTIDMSKFNTINLQKALAESMRELMGEEEVSDDTKVTRQLVSPMIEDDDKAATSYTTKFYTNPLENVPEDYDDGAMVYTENGEPLYTDDGEIYYTADGVVYEGDLYYPEEYFEEELIEEEIVDELPEEIYEENIEATDDTKEASEEEEVVDEFATKTVHVYEDPLPEPYKTTEINLDTAQINLGDTTEIKGVPVTQDTVEIKAPEETTEIKGTPIYEETFFEDKTSDIILDNSVMNQAGIDAVSSEKSSITLDPINPENHKFDDVLSVGTDGQIALVMPAEITLEKQITGQMSLEDVLAEWEKVKQKKQAQQDEVVRQNILDHTGKIFSDYDESVKNGILAQIEEEQKMQRRVLNNKIELKKYEDIIEKTEPESVPFDATAALNKVYDSRIWDEVDRAIEEDKNKAQANATQKAEGGVLSGVVAAGAGIAAAGAGIAAAGAAVAAGAAATEGAAVAGAVATESAAVAGTVATGAAVAEGAVASGVTAIGGAVVNAAKTAEAASLEKASVDANDAIVEVQNESLKNIENISEAAQSEESEAIAEAEETVSEVIDDQSDSEEVYIEDEEEYIEDGEIDYESEEYYEEESQTEEVYDNSLNTAQINDIEQALEEAADKASEMAVEESNDNYEGEDDRDFSYDEQEIFEDFLYSKKMRAQILEAVDIISLASYVGNVIITGESGSGTLNLAKAVIKEIQLIDNNFISSKVAKISGAKMNQKDIPGMFMQLSNGALIIEKAGKLTKDTLENITRALENATDGIIVIMTDTKKEIDKIVDNYHVLTGYFNARIDIVPMSNNALVEYAKKYAYSREYRIDEERGVLALHSRISDLQIGSHNVTTREVEEIVDEAIENSKRPKISTFINVLVGKRYDYEDMIILRENDFNS